MYKKRFSEANKYNNSASGAFELLSSISSFNKSALQKAIYFPDVAGTWIVIDKNKKFGAVVYTNEGDFESIEAEDINSVLRQAGGLNKGFTL